MTSSRSAAFRLLKTSHPRRLLLSSASATNNDVDSVSQNSNAGDVLDAPSFTIYYNDVYEVDMPPGHRFPMKKYALVRDSQLKLA